MTTEEKKKAMTDLANQIAARYVRFVKKMAKRRKLRIFPSESLNNWVLTRIFEETERSRKMNHLAYGMATLLMDQKDRPKDEFELMRLSRRFFDDAEKFFDENADLFAEATLEKEANP